MVENTNVRSADPAGLAQEAEAVRRLLKSVRRGEPIDWDSATRECPSFMSRYGDGVRSLQLAAENRFAGLLSSACEQDADSSLVDVLADALPGYRIDMEVGRGGQGVVYEAMHTATKRRVAIKVLLAGPFASKAQHGRFAREVELVARLRHPGIVQVYETGVAAGHAFFAMELVEGLPFDDHALLYRLSVRETVSLFIHVVDAVSHAHQRGVIHRDLKPSNVLVDASGAPRVLDFGLAKDLDAAGERTVTGQVLGTPSYAAPEQVLGLHSEIDVRTDVYTLGVVLFKAITGAFPYPVEGTTREILDAITTREPRRLREAISDEVDPGFGSLEGLNEDLERIVRKALSKEPPHRYQSADAFGQDLRRYLMGEAVEARSASGVYLLRKALRRMRGRLAVAALFVIVVAGALIGVRTARQQSANAASIAQSGLQSASFLRIGQVRRDEGRTDDAIEMLQHAIDAASSAPPNHPLVREQVFTSHFALAEIHFQREDFESMRPHIAAATELSSKMEASDPHDRRVQRLTAFAHRLRATDAAADGRWSEAVVELRAAEPIFRSLLDGVEGSERVQFDLAGTLFLRSKYERRAGLMDAAWATCEDALALLRELHRSNPEKPAYAVECSRVEGELAFLHLKRKTAESNAIAADLMQSACSRLRALRIADSARAYASQIDRLLPALESNESLARRRLRGTPATGDP